MSITTVTSMYYTSIMTGILLHEYYYSEYYYMSITIMSISNQLVADQWLKVYNYLSADMVTWISTLVGMYKCMQGKISSDTQRVILM